jgi:hypothetical protein
VLCGVLFEFELHVTLDGILMKKQLCVCIKRIRDKKKIILPEQVYMHL